MSSECPSNIDNVLMVGALLMKCANCGAEWTPPKSNNSFNSVCPFCGASLTKKMSDSFDDVLSVIVVNHGIDALKNERMALGLFSDYAPKLRREHSLLKLFYSCEGASILFLALKSDVAEQELLKNKVVAQMRENWIAEDAAMLVCNSFLKAIRQNGSMRATLSLPEISKAPSKENADERALSSKIRKNDKSSSKERAEDASDVSKVQKHLGLL